MCLHIYVAEAVFKWSGEMALFGIAASHCTINSSSVKEELISAARSASFLDKSSSTGSLYLSLQSTELVHFLRISCWQLKSASTGLSVMVLGGHFSVTGSVSSRLTTVVKDTYTTAQLTTSSDEEVSALWDTTKAYVGTDFSKIHFQMSEILFTLSSHGIWDRNAMDVSKSLHLWYTLAIS